MGSAQTRGYFEVPSPGATNSGRHAAGHRLTAPVFFKSGVEPLAECSLVVAPYGEGTDHTGAIAVLGPTRMNYPETVSAVAVVSQRLNRMLTEG